MFVTGPNVVRAVTHEDVDFERLGGATTHTTSSGVAHIATPDEATALDTARRILSFLPQNNVDDPPRVAASDPADRRDSALDASSPTIRRSRTTCTT
jgi:acetyl-CoA carboxylase carboxyltransferase component